MLTEEADISWHEVTSNCLIIALDIISFFSSGDILVWIWKYIIFLNYVLL